jgi:hypothetical protein
LNPRTWVLKASTLPLDHRSRSFSTLSHKCRDFPKKNLLHIKCVLSFSTGFVWCFSYFKNNFARYHHKHSQVFIQNTRYSCHISMKLDLSWHFRKILTFKIL